MSRLYRCVPGLLLLIASLSGCTQATQPALTGGEYRLRLVFDGLVTIARDQPGKPGEAWVLVGNASQPKQLLVGQNIPPHMSHLLVRVKDNNGGVEATVSGRPLSPPATKTGLVGLWQETELTGEDLRLAVTETSTKFNLEFDQFRRKQPCNPQKWYFFCWPNRFKRQHDNLGWTVDLDDALAELPGSPDAKKVKKCLTEQPYSCKDSPVLLNARLKLDNSRVFVSKLIGESDDTESEPGAELPYFRLEGGGRTVTRTRAQAEQAAAELIVSGTVEIRSERLGQPGVALETIRIQGEPGKTVEIRLANHVDRKKCETESTAPGEAASNCTDNDFLFNFNLLNDPLFIAASQLPVPTPEIPGGPAFNSQCSPSSYRP